MHNRRAQAFTLIEVMVVVMIVGIIASIAVPSWIRSRDRSRKMTCLANMKTMEDAKDLYAIAKRLSNGESVDESQLFSEFMKGSVIPVCPGGGTYTVNVIGTQVECSTHGKVDGSAE